MAEFENAKPGDKVFECNGGFGCRTLQVHTIEKVGKLHITLAGGVKINLRTGYRVGDSDRWSRAWYRPYDEQEWNDYRAQLEYKRKVREVRDFDWHHAERELIERVYELLPKQREVSHV